MRWMAKGRGHQEREGKQYEGGDGLLGSSPVQPAG